MRNEQRLLELASRQHALVHRRQVSELGISADHLHVLVSRRRWRWISYTVLALVGSPDTEEQRALAAVLDLQRGAAVSHHSAATMWSLPGFTHEPIHVTGARDVGHRRGHLAIVHQPRLILPDQILVFRQVPVTSPTRTLFDLAGAIHPKRLERAVDNALAMGLTTPRRLRGMLTVLARRGRPGIRVMRQIIDARPDSYRPPASGLEARFHRLAAKTGITGFVRQADTGDDERWLGRIDLRHSIYPLLVEVDSDRFHTSLLDRTSDAARDAALRAAGYEVVRYTEHQIWHEPEHVGRTLREAFWRVKNRPTAVLHSPERAGDRAAS